jgi:hypothetical protein
MKLRLPFFRLPVSLGSPGHQPPPPFCEGLGLGDGEMLGLILGDIDGLMDGLIDGEMLGEIDGDMLGLILGDIDGLRDGLIEGERLLEMLGLRLGEILNEGDILGDRLLDGLRLGDIDGDIPRLLETDLETLRDIIGGLEANILILGERLGDALAELQIPPKIDGFEGLTTEGDDTGKKPDIMLSFGDDDTTLIFGNDISHDDSGYMPMSLLSLPMSPPLLCNKTL